MSVNHRHRVVHSFLKGGTGVSIIARASCYFSAASANKIDSFADLTMISNAPMAIRYITFGIFC